MLRSVDLKQLCKGLKEIKKTALHELDNTLKSGYVFTSESVPDGHTDKICDQISDAVLDAYLRVDPNSSRN